MISLPKQQQLSKLIYTILGLNPGPFTLQGTNTYIIGQGKNRFLIDTGEGIEEYGDNLSKYLEENNCQIDQVLITHRHRDHVGGIKDILKFNKNIKISKFNIDDEDQKYQEQYGFQYNLLQDQQIIQGEDFNLKVLRLSGHCNDHICFYLFEEKTLLCGDFILSGSSSVVFDVKFQFESFEKVLELEIENLFSSHGPPIFSAEKSIGEIKKNYEHRKQREQQILQQLSLVKQKEEEIKQDLTIQNLRELIYPQLQDQNLIQGALFNIKNHLEKLILENKVKIDKEKNTYSLIQN